MHDSTDKPRPLNAISFDPVQMDTIRRALDAAAELETQSLEGRCADCDPDPGGRCDTHAASTSWRQEYRDLRHQLQPETERDAQLEA